LVGLPNGGAMLIIGTTIFFLSLIIGLALCSRYPDKMFSARKYIIPFVIWVIGGMLL
jgi:hypothetical protein